MKHIKNVSDLFQNILKINVLLLILNTYFVNIMVQIIYLQFVKSSKNYKEILLLMMLNIGKTLICKKWRECYFCKI